MPTTKKIDVRFDDKTYDTISSLASKQGITNSQLIRKLVAIGLDKDLAAESIDFVRDQINAEIKATCLPQFNRISKLIAKMGYQSVSTFYLLAYIMDSIIPVQKQQDFFEIKRNSKAMAISYLKLNEQEFAEFMLSEDRALNELTWDSEG